MVIETKNDFAIWRKFALSINPELGWSLKLTGVNKRPFNRLLLSINPELGWSLKLSGLDLGAGAEVVLSINPELGWSLKQLHRPKHR